MSSVERVGYAVAGLALFIVSLQVMGEATGELTPVLEGYMKILVADPLSALGFGWIASYVMLTGATAAALGMALLSSDILSSIEAFMVVSGSRMGAAFIVVIIGVAEYLRGKNEDIRDSCSIGILTFLLTYLVYIPAIVAGFIVVSRVDMASVNLLETGGIFVIFGLFDPVVDVIMSVVPSWAGFVLGLLGFFFGLEVFDRAFSGISAESFENEYVRFLLGNRWIAFLIGSLVTLVSTSVSISVGLIVPLYNRGFISRQEIIPYLMGANVTTIGSVIFASVVLGTHVGLNIALLLAGIVFLVTVSYMVVYDMFFNLVKLLFDKIVADIRVLGVFVASLTVLPVLLILL